MLNVAAYTDEDDDYRNTKAHSDIPLPELLTQTPKNTGAKRKYDNAANYYPRNNNYQSNNYQNNRNDNYNPRQNNYHNNRNYSNPQREYAPPPFKRYDRNE